MASHSRSSSSENVTDLDLYIILDIPPDASDSIIKKAYRKKALKCHPDKNPDNPLAAAEWDRLGKALEILTDPDARAAYDRVLKARKAAELRNRALESKRKKIKEDLESREASFRKEHESNAAASFRLQEEITRLREEGSRTLKKEQELLKNELLQSHSPQEEETPKLKIKWKSQKGDVLNGGYSYQYLKQALDKYGDVRNLVLSNKRNGSAIIEFSSVHAAVLAVANEFGLPQNPLQLTWLSGKPEESLPTVSTPQTSADDGDFERLVLEKLLQAGQMKPEDREIREGKFAESEIFVREHTSTVETEARELDEELLDK